MVVHGKQLFFTILSLLLIMPAQVFASGEAHLQDFTAHWGGIICIIVFCLAYSLVIAEEQIHLRKSKPVMLAAGIIWMIVAIVYNQHGDQHTAEIMVRHNLLEFGELFLFLLAAMTYINTMEDRNVFDKLRAWLVSQGFSLRTIFWITGAISFLLSPIADNLTTALLMSTVAMAVGGTNIKFVSIACINIVVAANAGGAFSPFGDITTLMVWQKGIIEFQNFFVLFVPSLVNWLIPAAIMSFFVSSDKPDAIDEKIELKDGAFIVIVLFILTIIMAVCAHNFLHMPPVLGMMTGLAFLKIFGYFLKIKIKRENNKIENDDGGAGALGVESFGDRDVGKKEEFNIFKKLARAEWDTLMFFYGVILCVGGLGTMGYLAALSEFMYVDLGPTTANILVGILSAIIDNIPVMFAVLTMLPEMDTTQWLLVTLTAGTGGSLLSVGSAAGVAVMGQARGVYTFFAHLKWTWAIALGYMASIWVHFLING
ncbi:MAG TPA: sodium:proton antiporter [Thiotrichaceae bacterium]|jgi:NhaD family Na+/H+ antiporter|nr:sodium:proton antiporter [Thiotrichaceae bacterium]HIM07830.1 sodium:proton antiporter [Gammaproteobacteria bacterium]